MLAAQCEERAADCTDDNSFILALQKLCLFALENWENTEVKKVVTKIKRSCFPPPRELEITWHVSF